MQTVTECDVVVVGGGGAGLAAAAEAAGLGLNVVLLEKGPELGGSTAWSLGAISANGTHNPLVPGSSPGGPTT